MAGIFTQNGVANGKTQRSLEGQSKPVPIRQMACTVFETIHGADSPYDVFQHFAYCGITVDGSDIQGYYR